MRAMVDDLSDLPVDLRATLLVSSHGLATIVERSAHTLYRFSYICHSPRRGKAEMGPAPGSKTIE